MARFDQFLRQKQQWTNSQTVFEVDVDDVPQELPDAIIQWIGSSYGSNFNCFSLTDLETVHRCDPTFIKDPKQKPLSFASASQMRAAVNYGFNRNLRRECLWYYDHQLAKFIGNPAQSVAVTRYMKNLQAKKARAGEFSTSSRAANGDIMQELHQNLLKWIERNASPDKRSFPKDSDDWGGIKKRLSTWLIGLIAFRCLLRTIDVLVLKIEDLDTLPLHRNNTHIGIRPRTTKTQQRGSKHKFELFVTDGKLENFCIVRGIRAWLHLTGITSGYLFPKIYGYDSLQASESHMDKKSFLKNLRCSLTEIGEPPELYTVHAFRRGGTQFLYVDMNFDLIQILEWGRWSTKLTYATILRYLIADTD
ncbi:hypothetical protein EV360DRAFT_58519, partial [Lentinula raphanica]